ncbi:MAG: hypothetical protein U0R19_14895 [Bryobacteraceae bacterium]
MADQIRQDTGGSLLVHYMAPLVDGDEVFTMSRGASRWLSCRNNPEPCGPRRWEQMEWGVTKLRNTGGALRDEWTTMSTWKPAPDNGSGWEPVFHPVLHGPFVYVPADSGMIMKLDRQSGAVLECIQPFPENDPNRFVTSPLTLDSDGSLYYTVMQLDASAPWTSDVQGAWLIKINPKGRARRVRFIKLVEDAPQQHCTTVFAANQLPWPPSEDAKAPTAPCGSQRPGLNAAPAIAPDGTIYVVSRAHFNPAYAYLVAVNPDLTTRWSASLRDRLNDGCDVLLPPSGTLGGCRLGSRAGVDPSTNEMPAGRVMDQATSSPVVAPDGSVLYGAYTRYNYGRGHLFRFSAAGEFLGSYDYGWDITPAIYEHDDTWSVILKDNFYPSGSYCSVLGQCGEGAPSFRITSLDADLRREWSYENTNDQACERKDDGSVSCTPTGERFEWCVNMLAVDRDGVVYANSEDGNLYAIDRSGQSLGSVFLKRAQGAAYTPLAIGGDGLIYTQNDGTLFVVGSH